MYELTTEQIQEQCDRCISPIHRAPLYSSFTLAEKITFINQLRSLREKEVVDYRKTRKKKNGNRVKAAARKPRKKKAVALSQDAKDFLSTLPPDLQKGLL